MYYMYYIYESSVINQIWVFSEVFFQVPYKIEIAVNNAKLFSFVFKNYYLNTYLKIRLHSNVTQKICEEKYNSGLELFN